MNWRDPKKQLPKAGDKVWLLLPPHKPRGSLIDSAMSVEIVCGEVCHYGHIVRVENNDELGQGNVAWLLQGESEFEENALYWLPLNEMNLPKE